MSLVKASLLNSIAVATRIVSALVLNKILAVFVGPAGYAIIGQFQNAVSILVSLAGGLIATGVTKVTSQHYDNEVKQHKVWQTALRFSLWVSLLASLALLLVNQQLARWLLQRADMSSIFVWLALTLPAMAANNVLLGIVNGKKEVGIYVATNITGSLVSMVVTGLLAYNFGLFGALLAFTINPAIVLLTTGALIARRAWFKSHFLWGRIDPSSVKELSGFALMGITSAIAVPVSYMLIRDHLTTHLGLPAAGYWQASWKISEIYLMLITSTLSAYYLPRLAEIQTAPELKAEIIKVYRFVMPIVIIGALTIYLLRDTIIHALFSSEFSPMRELFAWQLFGDVIKIGAWVLGYVILGRSLVKVFIIKEIAFAISFVLASWWLSDQLGLVGVPIAYAINYALYLFVTAYIVKYEMKKMTRSTHNHK